jgi:hypothetical protein
VIAGKGGGRRMTRPNRRPASKPESGIPVLILALTAASIP